MANLSYTQTSEIRAEVRSKKQAEEKQINDQIAALRQERMGLYTRFSDLERDRLSEAEEAGDVTMAQRSEMKTEIAALKKEEENRIDVETRKLVEEKSALFTKFQDLEKQMIAAAESGEEPESIEEDIEEEEAEEAGDEAEEAGDEAEEAGDEAEEAGDDFEEKETGEAGDDEQAEIDAGLADISDDDDDEHAGVEDAEAKLEEPVADDASAEEPAPPDTAVLVPKPVLAAVVPVPPVIDVPASDTEGSVDASVVVPLELVSDDTGKSEALRATLDISQAWLRGFAGEDSQFASSPQFRIVRDEANAWHLENTSPKNPTFLNGAEPEGDRVPLADGDVLSIGSRKGNPDKMKLRVKISG